MERAGESEEEEDAEGHNTEEGDSEEDNTEGDLMEEDEPVENSADDVSMADADESDGESKDAPMSDAGAGDAAEEQTFTTLPELAAKYPSFVVKKGWTPMPRAVSPETHMIDILLDSLDHRSVMDHRTLLRTCRLLQVGWLPGVEKTLPVDTTKSIPKKLADFIKECSEVKGLPFDSKEVATEWRDARKDIKGGGVWQPLADALFSDVFNRLCSYAAAKKLFQQKNFRVKDWDGFGRINAAGQVLPRNKVQLKTNYENQYHWQKVEIPETSKTEGRVEFRSTPFLTKWIRDDEVKEYDTVDCIPPGCVVPPKTFNTWPGFRAETLPPVPEDQVDELIRPVIEHIQNVICASDQEVQFYLATKAQQVQKPAEKSEVGIILSGPQGAGKNIHSTWYAESVLGAGVALQTGKVQHIMGKHSTALQNKVFCLLDEANYETLKPYADEIKNLMTGKTLDLDPKNKDQFTTRSLVNLELTTNNDRSIHLEAGERRWVVFECNDSKKDNTAYFDRLGKHLKNDRTARAFYQFLLKFDLSDYGNFQAKRPHTRLYAEMKEGNLSAFHSFLSHECMRCAGARQLFSPVENEVGCSTGPLGPLEKPEKTPEKSESCTAAAMFAKFMKWVGDANFEIGSYNSTNLGLDFKNLMKRKDNGVTKKRIGSAQTYTIEWSKLEKCLKHSGLFNNNV